MSPASARKLFRQSVGYGVATLSGPVLQYLLVPVYSRVLHVGDYGQVFLMVTVAGLVELLCKLAINVPLVRLYYEAKTEVERRIHIGTFFWLQVAYNVILVGTVLLFAEPINELIGNADQPLSFLILSVLGGGMRSLSNIASGVLRVREDVSGYFWLIGGSNVVQKLVAVVAITALHGGLHGYFWSIFWTSAATFVVSAALMLKWGGFHFNSVLARHGFMLALPLGLTQLLSWATNLSDRVIINRSFDSAAVAVYSMGYQFGFILTYIDTAVYSAFAPMFYREESEGGHGPQLISRFSTYFFLAAAGLGAILTGCSKELILVFSTPDYLASRAVIPIVAGAYAINQMFTFCGPIAVLQKKPLRLTAVSGMAALLNVTLNLLLVPTFGYIAAAWNTLVSTSVSSLIALVLTLRAYRLQIEWLRFAKIAAACIFTAICGWFISSGPAWLALVVKAIALPAALLASLQALRFFSIGERQWFVGKFRAALRGLSER